MCYRTKFGRSKSNRVDVCKVSKINYKLYQPLRHNTEQNITYWSIRKFSLKVKVGI